MSAPRSAILLWLVASTGCAAPIYRSGTNGPEPESGNPPPTTPTPVPDPPGVLPVPDRLPLLVPDPDSLAAARALADSLADARVLEQLNNALAPPGDDGDDVPVTWDIDVATWAEHQRVQYYLDFFQGAARDRMQIWLERMPRYEGMIRERLVEANLPSDLVYLALIESGFSNSAVSRSRAVGMWQFIAGTARMYGLRVDRWVDERRDPALATDAAVRYLADLTTQFGSPYVAAAAYNAGPGRVQRGLGRVSGLQGNPTGPGVSDEAFFQLSDTRYIRQETKDYVPKLIAAALIAKQPERYGFPPIGAPATETLDSLVTTDAVGLDVLARLADTSLAALRELNPHLLRGVTPPNHSAVVRLPAGRGQRTAARLADLPASERVTFREHVVRKGETLGGIAARYRVSIRDLEDANPRVRPRSLSIGHVLTIPVLGVNRSSRSTPTSKGRASDAGAPDRSPTATHVVRRGETLSTIASRYGTSTGALRAMNELDSDLIKVGQKLRVEGGASFSSGRSARPAGHVVRRGETLSGLAERFGTTVKALMAANRLRSTAIRAGTRLTIPD